MPLKQKQIENNEGREERQVPGLPLDRNLRWEIASPDRFPAPANLCCSGSGVARNEISGPNRSGEVGALWEVLALVAGGEDAAVATGSGSAPGAVFSLFTDDFQGPASVDASYGTPANSHVASRIYDAHEVFAHLNSRKPKEHQGQIANQGSRGKANECGFNSLCDIGHGNAQGHYRHGCGCDYSARSRAVNLHSSMFAPRLVVS